MKLSRNTNILIVVSVLWEEATQKLSPKKATA